MLRLTGQRRSCSAQRDTLSFMSAHLGGCFFLVLVMGKWAWPLVFCLRAFIPAAHLKSIKLAHLLPVSASTSPPACRLKVELVFQLLTENRISSLHFHISISFVWFLCSSNPSSVWHWSKVRPNIKLNPLQTGPP